MTLKVRIQDDMKSALRARDKERLGALRLILAGIQQREIDERAVLDDARIINVLERMLKQRRESIRQYRDAGREDLAAKESFESEIIRSYLPVALTDAELDALVESAIATMGANSVRDMGKVMNLIKDRARGRADMGVVSALVKKRLAG